MPAVERPRLSELTAPQLFARAVEYRRMAATAAMPHVRESLIRLADRLERLAAERDKASNAATFEQ